MAFLLKNHHMESPDEDDEVYFGVGEILFELGRQLAKIQAEIESMGLES